MNDDESDDSTLAVKAATIVLGTLLLLIAMVLWSVHRFPGIMWQGGRMYESGTIAALLAYAGIAYGVRGVEAIPARMVLRIGTIAGVVLAGLEMLLHLAETHFGNPATNVMPVAYTSLALSLLAFGGTCWLARRSVPSMFLAVIASVWVAVVSTTCLSLLSFASTMLLTTPLSPTLFSAYEASGMTDPQAFVIRQTLEGAPIHLMVAPAEAMAVAVIVAWFGALRRTMGKPLTKGQYR